MFKAYRYLGFGFAAADLLIEINESGAVEFALGAGEAVLGVQDQAMLLRDWRTLIDPADHAMVMALFSGLVDGARAGPVVIGVATPDGAAPKFASLIAIRLPQNEGAISCAVSRAKTRGPVGLQTVDEFRSRVTQLLAGASEDLEVSFVELEGLSSAIAALQDPVGIGDLVEGTLRAQAYRGEPAAAVGPERYAVLRGLDEPEGAMSNRIEQALKQSGVEGVTPRIEAIALAGVERPKQLAQALRYALNQVIDSGLSRPLPADLSEALNLALRTTMNKAGVLGAAIRYRRFSLAYQPVISLHTGALHHHEVLVRFGSEGSPFPTIRMAEEMDLIEALDGAILEEALRTLRGDPDLILAVNVSGRSIMSEGYVKRAVGLLRLQPEVQGRLMFELTESAAIEDLALADRHLQALKAVGCEICLDDFGAGAASLAYLQQLTLDLLKIDGRYIRDLQHGGREATFVKHLVNMCAELNVRTLAEMVETPEAEDAVRRAGVDLAQGWFYGRAAETPIDAATLASRGRGPAGALALSSALDH